MRVTRQHRAEPRLARIREAGETVYPDVVPVIPVRMLEAWMLADPEALAKAPGTGGAPRDLGLPDQPY